MDRTLNWSAWKACPPNSCPTDVIGAVYDCAIDPELWPAACKTIAGLSASTAGGICVHDLKHRTSVVRRSVLFCTCLARPVGLVADQPALPE